MDTEDDSKGKCFLWNFYDGEKHFTFYNIQAAAEWLGAQEGILEIWCTNLGYDLNNLLQEYKHAIEISYVDSRIISARLIGAMVYFKDTLNHWKISVAEMGNRIGLKKMDIDAANIYQEFRRSPNRVVRYCRRDTEITFKFVIAMKTQYEAMGCNLKSTVGSTALTHFYNNFWHRPTPEEIFKKDEIDFCRGGYYGGRTEIFHTNPVSGNISYYDFNSLYPAVMRNTFPLLENRYWTTKPNFELEGMVDVEIQAPKIYLPYLPCRMEKRGLLFPSGTFRGVYTYVELRKAFDFGYRIRKSYKALEFPFTCRPFEGFVSALYEKRLEAQARKDALMSDTCKLLMNNLFGKFGQGNEYSKLISIDEAKKLRPHDILMGEYILRKFKGAYPAHSNGIWSSYVTAYARDLLYSALIKVVDNKGLLIYCDTDSIIYESDKKIFEHSKELGGLKLEGDYEYAHFKLPKLYTLIDKRRSRIYKAKGVPTKAALDFFETGHATFRRPYKLREVLRRNLSPKRTYKLVPNYWEITSKDIRKKYDKRKSKKDGSTVPVILQIENKKRGRELFSPQK